MMHLKHLLMRLLIWNKKRYHPEKHYLRGPGPACQKTQETKQFN